MSCPNCFGGHIHEGTPKGRITKPHGLDTYIAGPELGVGRRGILVIIPDAFGWEFVNNRLLADRYAEKGGYTVYLPDFMNGHAAPVWSIDTIKSVFKTGSILDWIEKPYHFLCMLSVMIPFMISNRFSIPWPIVHNFFASIRQNEGSDLSISAAGFCWGGKHTVHLAHGHLAPNGRSLIDAGFAGHPSNLVIPGEIEEIEKPVSFAIGDRGIAVSIPQVEEIRRIVEGKGTGATGQVKVYYGAGHGFCVRADHVLLDAERQAAEVEEQALEWFQRHFWDLS